MFEILVIQDLGSSWAGLDLMFQVLDEQNGAEEVTFVDTDPNNESFIKKLGVSRTPALVFVHDLRNGKAAILDRITGPVTKQNIEQRYLQALNSPIILGDSSGVDPADIISIVDDKNGGENSNTLLGLGLFNFGLPFAKWLWLLIGGYAVINGAGKRKPNYLLIGAGGLALYNAYKLHQNEK